MLIYFFCITYGIYFSTIIEFICYTDLYIIKYTKYDIYTFDEGRQQWDYFDLDLLSEVNSIHSDRLG